MRKSQPYHVQFDLEDDTPKSRYTVSGMSLKRICEWKNLNLRIDSQSLRQDILEASEAVSDPWSNVGKDTGITIWRVTKYRATLWPSEEYGQFYDADAFIVLNTHYIDVETELVQHNIHIWIGKYAQKEEYEAVVVKCLELDWKLGYEAIVHREVQSRESDLFRSYFKPMTIWKGDAERRLRSLKGEVYPARLLRFYKPDSRRPFTCMKEVPTQRKFLDSSLIYVMDLGHQIYQWNGEDCNREEKAEVLKYCQKMRADRGMKCDYEMIEENESQDHYFHFYFKDGIDSGSLVDSDDETNTRVSEYATLGGRVLLPQLYQAVEKDDKMGFRILKEGQVVAQDFVKQKVCILDLNHRCFVWISAQNAPEKRLALQYAHEYLKYTPHPLIPVTVVREGQPSPAFERAINFTVQNGFH